MGNIRLYGSTSGYTELAPPAVAPDGVLSLPSGVGTLLTAEGGKVLQVVQSISTTTTTTTSATFVTSNLTGSITPVSTSNKVLAIVSASISNSANSQGYWTLYRGTVSDTNLGNGNSGFALFSAGSVALLSHLSIVYLDSPNTTSSQTYTLAIRANTLTTGINPAGSASTMILMEVSA